MSVDSSDLILQLQRQMHEANLARLSSLESQMARQTSNFTDQLSKQTEILIQIAHSTAALPLRLDNVEKDIAANCDDISKMKTDINRAKGGGAVLIFLGGVLDFVFHKIWK